MNSWFLSLTWQTLYKYLLDKWMNLRWIKILDSLGKVVQNHLPVSILLLFSVFLCFGGGPWCYIPYIVLWCWFAWACTVLWSLSGLANKRDLNLLWLIQTCFHNNCFVCFLGLFLVIFLKLNQRPDCYILHTWVFIQNFFQCMPLGDLPVLVEKPTL